MTDSLVVPCAHCAGLNRIPADRVGQHPRCGRCKNEVLVAKPFEVNQGNFAQQIKGDLPLLLDVWASWCAPCVEEMPELARFAHTQGDNGVQVLGLALDTPEDVRGFLQRVPVDYPIVIETPGPRDASVQLGNTQGLLPYSVLFDAQGRLVKAKLGPFAHGEIDSWVK